MIACAGVLEAGPAPFEARWRELKTSLSNQDLYRLAWALPKGGDIHNHHEYKEYSAADWRDRLSRIQPRPSGSTARVMRLRTK